MTYRDGGPAFPCLEAKNAPNEGMSLRDYFAGQALAGQAAQPTDGDVRAIAWYCYELADAMLKAREAQR